MAKDSPEADRPNPLGWVIVGALLAIRVLAEIFNLPAVVWWATGLAVALIAWPVMYRKDVTVAAGYVTLAFLFVLGSLVLWMFSK